MNQKLTSEADSFSKEYEKYIPFELRSQIRRIDRQLAVNQDDAKGLEALIEQICLDSERAMRVLDSTDESEGTLRFLLQYWYRNDLTNRCARLLMDEEFTENDLKRMFGIRIFNDAVLLYHQAHAAWENIEEPEALECSDDPEQIYTHDPSADKMFQECTRALRLLDETDETEGTLRFLIRDWYRNELVCLCARYFLDREMSLTELRAMFGTDICTEAEQLYEEFHRHWKEGDPLPDISR